MKFLKPVLLVLFLSAFMLNCTEEVDECEEKLENGINPKLILPEADEWVTNAIEETIEFINEDGDVRLVELLINEMDSTDVSCPNIIYERHLYKYKVSDTSLIVARERGSKLSVTTDGTGGKYNNDIFGEIDHLGNLYLDATSKIDEISIQESIWYDLVLINHSQLEELLIDSMYFAKGTGLVSFEYLDEQWLRL